jgi:hypothetical protein
VFGLQRPVLNTLFKHQRPGDLLSFAGRNEILKGWIASLAREEAKQPSFIFTSLDIPFQQNSPEAAAGRAARPSDISAAAKSLCSRLTGDFALACGCE